MMKELNPDERYVWFGFILLAGDCAHEGEIGATENSGFTDDQLADLLKVEKELIQRSKRKFIKYEKITVAPSGIIFILKWKLYQSEYDRQKSYRVKLRVGVTNSSISISSSLNDSLIFSGIEDKDKESWKKAYPACDVESELLKMIEWIKANPDRGKKSNYRRFITNWLSRQQDRGGTNRQPGNRPAGANEPEWLKKGWAAHEKRKRAEEEKESKS